MALLKSMDALILCFYVGDGLEPLISKDSLRMAHELLMMALEVSEVGSCTSLAQVGF